MKSIISEIFNGNRGNNETFKLSQNYKKISDKISAVYDELKAKIPPELAAQFENFCNLTADSEAVASEDNFIEGVKLGILLGVESCD